MNEAAAGMSPFEQAVYFWYCENVSEFTMKTGLMTEAFKELRLRGVRKRVFIVALARIHATFEAILADREKREAEHG